VTGPTRVAGLAGADWTAVVGAGWHGGLDDAGTLRLERTA
jgi:hypothetical protein